MLTLTNSQNAAVRAPDVEAQALVEIEAADGLYTFAREPLTYGGLQYSPRIVNLPPITSDLAGAGVGAPTARTIAIQLANADGFFSQWRPSQYRGRTLRIKEVALAVDSLPIRTFAFTMMGGGADGDTFTLEATDQWGDVGRRLVPRYVLTNSLYPQMDPSYEGRAIPWLFGRALVPLTAVDVLSQEENRMAACVNSAASGVGSGTDPLVYQLYNGRLFRVESARLEIRARGDFTMTEIMIASPIRAAGGGPLPHFADLVSQHSGGQLGPDQVLTDLIQSQYGANAPDVSINSDSLLRCHSFYEVSSLRFACALTEQRPLEEYLGAWAYGALTNVVLRDQVYLVPQASQAAVASLTVSNIAGVPTIRDLPMGTEDTTHQIQYTDRTSGFPAIEIFQAGSGSVFQHVSPFLGTPLCAGLVAQYRARRGASGIRNYQVVTGPDQVALEPADIVTLQHSLQCPVPQACEVQQQVGALTGTFQLGLREINYSVYSYQNPRQNGWFPIYGDWLTLKDLSLLNTTTSWAFTTTFNSMQLIYGVRLGGQEPEQALAIWTRREDQVAIVTSIVAWSPTGVLGGQDQLFVNFRYFGVSSTQNIQNVLSRLEVYLGGDAQPFVQESFSTYREEVIADGAMWYWSLTDAPTTPGSQTALASVMKGQNLFLAPFERAGAYDTGGAIRGNAAFSSASRPSERYALFDARSSSIMIVRSTGNTGWGLFQTSQAITIEAWCQHTNPSSPLAPNSRAYLLSWSITNGVMGTNLYLQGCFGEVNFSLGWGLATTTLVFSAGLASKNLCDGQLHHVVARKGVGLSTYMDIWVDGVMVASLAATINSFTHGTGGRLAVGATMGFGDSYLNGGFYGSVGEVAVYSVDINSAVIAKHFKAIGWTARDGSQAGGEYS